MRNLRFENLIILYIHYICSVLSYSDESEPTSIVYKLCYFSLATSSTRVSIQSAGLIPQLYFFTHIP